MCPRCGLPPACCGCWMPRSISRWNRSAPLRGRPAPKDPATPHRVLRAELFHRRRLGGCQCPALCAGKNGRGQYRRGGRDESPIPCATAFYAGGVALLGAIGWTVLRTREYPPDMLAHWDAAPTQASRSHHTVQIRLRLLPSLRACCWQPWWESRTLDKALYILAGLLDSGLPPPPVRTFLATRLASWMMCATCRRQWRNWRWCNSSHGLHCLRCGSTPPPHMGPFGSTDPASAAYNAGAN